MISRIKKELLDSDIDIRTSVLSEGDDARLTIVTKRGGVRIAFGVFFLVPGLLLLWNAIASWSLVGLVFALVFCPVLFGIFFIFGFGISEKRFDIGQRLFVRSFRLFGLMMVESDPIPESGNVVLSSKLSAGGGKTPGGSMRYSVAVSGCSGSGFSVYHDYQIASDFARKLAEFLSYQLENSVDPAYRKDMRSSSYR